LYRDMLLLRFFEERALRVFLEGAVVGTCHAGIGQEAIPVGIFSVLRPDDYAVSTHRGHGHMLAKGADPRRVMAELFGRRDGYAGGRGGSQHMACFEVGFLGSNGITGGGIPIATGAALACKMKRNGRVVVSFLGDGASNQGTFHESLNMAAIWKLPVIYACENNLYAMSSPWSEMAAVKDVAERGAAYGIPAEVVDGNDVLAVRESTARAAARARSGEGPTLIEFKTYRFCGHSRSDTMPYRTREEEAEWLIRCPILRFSERLRSLGILDDSSEAKLRSDAMRIVADAEEFARNSPEPDPESVAEGLFA